MSFAVRLSSRFYDRLGDEATNELAEWLNAMDENSYRRVRELYDHGNAQIVAEMRARFAEQDRRLSEQIAHLERQFIDLERRVTQRLADQDVRMADGFEDLQRQMGSLGTRLSWQMFGMFTTLLGVMIVMQTHLWHQ